MEPSWSQDEDRRAAVCRGARTRDSHWDGPMAR